VHTRLRVNTDAETAHALAVELLPLTTAAGAGGSAGGSAHRRVDRFLADCAAARQRMLARRSAAANASSSAGLGVDAGVGFGVGVGAHGARCPSALLRVSHRRELRGLSGRFSVGGLGVSLSFGRAAGAEDLRLVFDVYDGANAIPRAVYTAGAAQGQRNGGSGGGGDAAGADADADDFEEGAAPVEAPAPSPPPAQAQARKERPAPAAGAGATPTPAAAQSTPTPTPALTPTSTPTPAPTPADAETAQAPWRPSWLQLAGFALALLGLAG
jgi:hypothetical protein